jgi:N utilization substance protein A
MKTDFLLAITQLAAERNLPKEVVFSAVEKALVSAFKKDDAGAPQNLAVKIHPVSGDVKVYIQKVVTEEVTDPSREISLADARKLKKDTQIGETLLQETKAFHAGRIAAQTAKQVVLQRLREAEREFIFGEYIDREGDIVSGVVHRIEPKQIAVDLGKAEGILPISEQVRTEHHRIGQRLKLYLLEVNRTNRGPRLILSRSHPNLVRRLFELEVPEIHSGIVEIKGIAREPGFRTKVAVSAQQDGIDPVGSCVGLRGVRIQNVVNELNGERIDVVQWDAETSTYIANALSPAQVLSVTISEPENTATVVVADGQLSLAIGKEGQNARLAARLTGWKIDIKSASIAKAERAARAEEEALEPIPPSAAPVKERKKPTVEAAVPGQRLDETGLPTRTVNALLAVGLETVGQLLERTDNELLEIRNFGQKALEDVKELLATVELKAPPVVEAEVPPAEVVEPAKEEPEAVEQVADIETEVPAEGVEEAEEEEVVFYEAPVEEEVPASKPVIRFAEDIFTSEGGRGEGKKKGKKKGKAKGKASLEADQAKKRRSKAATESPSLDTASELLED